MRPRFLALLLPLLACSMGPTAGLSAESGTALAPAPANGFVATLSAEDRKAIGVEKLSTEEQSELDFLVTKELSLARAGNVRGFAGTFTSRRNPAERVAAGLDRLTTDEQAKLNELVATRLARRPDATSSVTRLKKEVVQKAKNPVELHGEVSFTYGWQKGGGEFKGGSIYVTAQDPDTGLAIGVGYAQYEGDGWWGYGPGYYYSAADPRLVASMNGGPSGCFRHR